LEPSSEREGSVSSDEELLGTASLTGVLKDSWRLYRRDFLRLFTLFAPGMALAFTAGSLWVLVAPAVDVAILFVAGSIFWFLLVPSLMGSALVLAAHVLMVDRLMGRETNSRLALAALRADVPSVLQCVLLASTGAMFFGLLRPLTLIFFVWWGPPLVGTTVIIENQPFPGAWAATRSRGRGRLSRSILILLLVSFGLSIMGFALAFPILVALGSITQTLFIILILALLTALVLPDRASSLLRHQSACRRALRSRVLASGKCAPFGLTVAASRRLRPKGSNPD
jgi:hypothetical protein